MKAVLLHNRNKHTSVPLAHAVRTKETYVSFQSLLKNNTLRRQPVEHGMTWKLWQRWLSCK